MDEDKDEKLREYRRQYYLKNKEKIKQRAMEWQQANHGAYIARLRAHRAKDPEVDRVRCRNWKNENRDAHNAASREYGRRNAKTISYKLKAKRRAIKQQIINGYGGKSVPNADRGWLPRGLSHSLFQLQQFPRVLRLLPPQPRQHGRRARAYATAD